MRIIVSIKFFTIGNFVEITIKPFKLSGEEKSQISDGPSWAESRAKHDTAIVRATAAAATPCDRRSAS